MNNSTETRVDFSTSETSALYRVIQERRDIRHFSPCDISDETLNRLLTAAHAAPSVGFMQPWDFIIIRNIEARKKIKQHVLSHKEAAGRHYSGKRAFLYHELKIEGITDCTLNVVVTCDSQRGGNINLGRVTMPETAQFSVCAAIQNFWLAARAEGLGVGWVSILDPKWLKRFLQIPDRIQLLALLCLGKPKEFPSKPLLETLGWRERECLENLVHQEVWLEKNSHNHRAKL